MRDGIDDWLERFALHVSLRDHVRAVVARLPDLVLQDFMSDQGFVLCDIDYKPWQQSEIPAQLGVKSPGRSVVLKRRMWRSEEPFIRWVIAHELAHAHLRNAGRFPGDDPEHAADALAADWGFPKPGR